MLDPTTALSAISIFLIAVILLQEYRHGKERRDLYNRLMARTVDEYANLNRAAPRQKRVRNFVNALKPHESEGE